MEKSSAHNAAEDDLFRPLETGSSRRQRRQILTSNRHVKRDKTAILDDDDQFFELWLCGVIECDHGGVAFYARWKSVEPILRMHSTIKRN